VCVCKREREGSWSISASLTPITGKRVFMCDVCDREREREREREIMVGLLFVDAHNWQVYVCV